LCILINDQSYTGLGIESLTNAPWNTISRPQPETRKGSATSLIEELVRESQRLQFNGIVKAITIPSARPFYRRIGFIETNGSGEMILTYDAAQDFLIRQQQLREVHHDPGN
jgi:predicted acetyltransferase